MSVCVSLTGFEEQIPLNVANSYTRAAEYHVIVLVT